MRPQLWNNNGLGFVSSNKKGGQKAENPKFSLPYIWINSFKLISSEKEGETPVTESVMNIADYIITDSSDKVAIDIDSGEMFEKMIQQKETQSLHLYDPRFELKTWRK